MAASAVNDKFCREHPGLCTPDQPRARGPASWRGSAARMSKSYAASLRNLVSDPDPAVDTRKKRRAYGVGIGGLAVVLLAGVAIGYYIHKRK